MLDPTLKVEPSSCKLDPSKSKSYSLNHLRNLLITDQPHPFFNLTSYVRSNKIYYCYASTKNQLVFVNASDSLDIHKTNFPYYGYGKRVFIMKFIGDTLHLLSKGDTTYAQLKINEDFSYTVLNKLDLRKIINIKNWFIHDNTLGNVFDYSYPYLLIPYGIRGPKNLLDSKAGLLIDIQSHSVKSIFSYPKCYSTCYVNDENASLAFCNNQAYCLPSYYSEVSRYSFSSSEESKYMLPMSNSFTPYDEAEISNMAYSRKYENTVERNTAILSLKSGDYLIIKKLSKKYIKDENEYRYYRYDATDKLICVGKLEFPIFSALTIPFESGFIATSADLTKCVYYELN